MKLRDQAQDSLISGKRLSLLKRLNPIELAHLLEPLLGCLPQGSLLKETLFDVPENWKEQKDRGWGVALERAPGGSEGGRGCGGGGTLCVVGAGPGYNRRPQLQPGEGGLPGYFVVESGFIPCGGATKPLPQHRPPQLQGC